MFFSGVHRLVHITFIIWRDFFPSRNDIRAVYGKAGDQFADGPDHILSREVPAVPMRLADFKEQRCQTVYVAPEQVSEHSMLLVPAHGRVISRFTRKFGVDTVKLLLVCWIHQEPARLIQVIVTGGSVNWPFGAKFLSRFKNLFSQNPDIRRLPSQMLKVSSGILQSVRVIDPDAVEDTSPEPAQNKGMSIRKHLFPLHPETDKRINVEK